MLTFRTKPEPGVKMLGRPIMSLKNQFQTQVLLGTRRRRYAIVIGGVLLMVIKIAHQTTTSLSHYPPALLPRQLGMTTIVFLRVLDWRHTMDSRGILELDAFVRVRTCPGVFLENTLGGAGVCVVVCRWLERGEPFPSRAGNSRGWRDGRARSNTRILER